jgi:hypothetical protein
MWLSINRIDMFAVAQYLVYFLVGALYFVVFILGQISLISKLSLDRAPMYLEILRRSPTHFLFLVGSLFLAGYASGLSFFYPRVAAIASIILVLPYFAIGVYDMFVEADPVRPTIAVVPTGVVILISVFALLWSKTSLWSRQEKTFGKVAIRIFAGLPALLATIILFYFSYFFINFLRSFY